MNSICRLSQLSHNSWPQLPGFSPFFVASRIFTRSCGSWRRTWGNFDTSLFAFSGPATRQRLDFIPSFCPVHVSFVLSALGWGGSEQVSDGLGVSTGRAGCPGGGDLQLVMN